MSKIPNLFGSQAIVLTKYTQLQDGSKIITGLQSFPSMKDAAESIISQANQLNPDSEARTMEGTQYVVTGVPFGSVSFKTSFELEDNLRRDSDTRETWQDLDRSSRAPATKVTMTYTDKESGARLVQVRSFDTLQQASRTVLSQQESFEGSEFSVDKKTGAMRYESTTGTVDFKFEKEFGGTTRLLSMTPETLQKASKENIAAVLVRTRTFDGDGKHSDVTKMRYYDTLEEAMTDTIYRTEGMANSGEHFERVKLQVPTTKEGGVVKAPGIKCYADDGKSTSKIESYCFAKVKTVDSEGHHTPYDYIFAQDQGWLQTYNTASSMLRASYSNPSSSLSTDVRNPYVDDVRKQPLDESCDKWKRFEPVEFEVPQSSVDFASEYDEVVPLSAMQTDCHRLHARPLRIKVQQGIDEQGWIEVNATVVPLKEGEVYDGTYKIAFPNNVTFVPRYDSRQYSNATSWASPKLIGAFATEATQFEDWQREARRQASNDKESQGGKPTKPLSSQLNGTAIGKFLQDDEPKPSDGKQNEGNEGNGGNNGTGSNGSPADGDGPKF